MALSPTKTRYSLAGLGTSSRIITWALEKLVGVLIPQGANEFLVWLSLASLFVLIGFLIADLTNPWSSLRSGWRGYWAMFKVGRFNRHYVTATPPTSWLDVTTTVKARGTYRGVSVKVVHRLVNNVANPDEPRTSVLHRNLNFVEGEERTIKIARLGLKPNSTPAYWYADEEKEGEHVIHGGQYLCALVFTCGNRDYSYTFRLEDLGQADYDCRLVVLTEDEHVPG